VVAGSCRGECNEFPKCEKGGKGKDDKKRNLAEIKSNGEDENQRPGCPDPGIDQTDAVGSELVALSPFCHPVADIGSDSRQEDKNRKNGKEGFLIGKSETHDLKLSG
jgi:hypothetical protein